MLSNSNSWEYTNFTLTLKCLDNDNKNEFPIEREKMFLVTVPIYMYHAFYLIHELKFSKHIF